MPFDLPETDVPLAPLSTLGVGGAARWFARAASASDVIAAHGWAAARDAALFVLGGGSNLVIADEGFDGLVLQVALRGVKAAVESEETIVRPEQANCGTRWLTSRSAADSRALNVSPVFPAPLAARQSRMSARTARRSPPLSSR